jgi:hypothetical protein
MGQIHNCYKSTGLWNVSEWQAYATTHNVVECMVLSASNIVTVLLYVYKCLVGHHPGYTVWLILVPLQKWVGARHVGSIFMVCVCWHLLRVLAVRFQKKIHVNVTSQLVYVPPCCLLMVTDKHKVQSPIALYQLWIWPMVIGISYSVWDQQYDPEVMTWSHRTPYLFSDVHFIVSCKTLWNLFNHFCVVEVHSCLVVCLFI